MEKTLYPEQGEFDFARPVADGYFESKEGLIFSLLREACPRDMISFRMAKGRRQFKIRESTGQTYQLYFTEPFLYSRSPSEIREHILQNLEYMKRVDNSSRALFGRGCVKIRDL